MTAVRERRLAGRRTAMVSLALLAAACGPGRTDAQGTPPRAPRALFAYDTAMPVSIEAESIASPNAAVALQRISFATAGGGRVTGQLAVPRSAGPHAGVVLMHGLPGDAPSAMTHEGLPMAARGAVVLAIDAPWARRGALIDLSPQDSVDQVQLIHDLQRAVDVLLTRADVDPQRIGYVGGSYGGAMGALFVGIERRLRAAVLFVPDGGLVAHFTDPRGEAIGPLAGVSPAARERWLAAMRPIEPIRFIADAAPTPILFQNGRTDALVTAEDAEALHRAAGEPKTVRWYAAGHGLTPAARVERHDWLFERFAR